MGLETGKYEIGANCAKCDGLLWPAGATPKYAFLLVQGVTMCPGFAGPPSNGYFQLTQEPGSPCDYKWNDGTIFIWLRYGVGTTLNIEKTLVGRMFQTAQIMCWTSGANQNVCGLPPCIAAGGSASWYMGFDPYAVLIAETYNFCPQKTILYDKFFTPEWDRVYRFARNIDKTNVKIKFEP